MCPLYLINTFRRLRWFFNDFQVFVPRSHQVLRAHEDNDRWASAAARVPPPRGQPCHVGTLCAGTPGGCSEPCPPGFAMIWALPVPQGDTGGKHFVFKPTRAFCSMPLTCPTQEPAAYPSLAHSLRGIFRTEEQNSSETSAKLQYLQSA